MLVMPSSTHLVNTRTLSHVAREPFRYWFTHGPTSLIITVPPPRIIFADRRAAMNVDRIPIEGMQVRL